MPETYTVRQEHLTVDLILWRRYGRRGQELLNATIELNRGLAARTPFLPVGLQILLPDLPSDTPATVAVQPVSLFD